MSSYGWPAMVNLEQAASYGKNRWQIQSYVVVHNE